MTPRPLPSTLDSISGLQQYPDPNEERRHRYPARACERCSHPYHPRRPNQKLCAGCRLLADLEYWNEGYAKASKCHLCSAKTLRTTRTREACAICDTSPYRGPCLVCLGTSLPLQKRDVPICRACSRDPRAGVRTACINHLRDWLGLAPTPPAEHPEVAAVREVARVTAARLGCSEGHALTLAKGALGLDPTDQTTDLPALRAALEAL